MVGDKKTFDINLGEERVTVDKERLYQELVRLGIDRYTIEQKHHKNLYVAEIIVEKYDFGRTLSIEEKRGLVQSILDHSLLDDGKRKYLSALIRKLQQYGFSEQDAYAIVINLGVNGSIIDEPKCSYTDVLNNTGGVVFKKISEGADRVEKTVTPFTIIKAASYTLKDEEIQRIKLELADLGIQEKELEGLDDKLIYIARRMAEEYIRDGSLKSIPIEDVVRSFLTLKFQPNPYRGGLRIQEQPFKDKLRKMQELDALISEFIDLGIDREYLRTRDKKRLIMAKKIINDYRFERTLTLEEKRALLQIIIDSDCYNSVRSYKKNGLSDEQEIYAKIINYGVYNKATTQPVTEEAIRRAVDKAKMVMQKAVYTSHSGRRWGTFNLRRVREGLEELAGGKKDKANKERY